jgi:hypothetical protein
MTAVFPDGVPTIGNESLRWVPSIADLAAPTVSEIVAGVAVQTAIRGFSPQGTQNSTEDIRLATKEKLENPGRNQVSIDAIEVLYDPHDPTNATKYKAYTALVPGSSGYLVDLRGIDEATTPVSGDIVDIYTCTLGVRNRVPVDAGQDGSKFASTIKPFITGPTKQDVALVTG